MSSLINDLNTIYNVKGQIKEVANIPTDVFSDFPTYIAAAIASGGATGEIEITTNGTHDVSTYASAYVNVPQETVPVVPEGYTYVTGSVTLSYNGQYDVSSYAYAVVEAEVPPGFIYPTGFGYITTNGDFPIREFAYVNVNVPTSGGLDWDDVAQAGYIVPAGTYNITTNGNYGISAYENVYVNVQGGGSTSYTLIDQYSDLYRDENSDLVDEWVGPADGTDVEVNGVTFSTTEVFELTSGVLAQFASMLPKTAEVLATHEGDWLYRIALYPKNWGAFVVVDSNHRPDGVTGGYRFTGKIYECGTGSGDYEFFPIIISNNDLSLVPHGGIGGYTITENANSIDVTSYSYVAVNVPSGISDGRNVTAVRFDSGDNYTYLTHTGSYFTYTGQLYMPTNDDPVEGNIDSFVQIRIADEVRDSEPLFRYSDIHHPVSIYLGDLINYYYGSSENMPASGTWIYNSDLGSDVNRFVLNGEDMYAWSSFQFNWTLKIPEDYYYRGNAYVYLDWTFSGVPAE